MVLCRVFGLNYLSLKPWIPLLIGLDVAGTLISKKKGSVAALSLGVTALILFMSPVTSVGLAVSPGKGLVISLSIGLLSLSGVSCSLHGTSEGTSSAVFVMLLFESDYQKFIIIFHIILSWVVMSFSSDLVSVYLPQINCYRHTHTCRNYLQIW